MDWSLTTVALALIAVAAVSKRLSGSPITPAIVIEDPQLPHEHLIVLAVYLTVGLSVFAHGLTAAPLADRYADWFERHP